MSKLYLVIYENDENVVNLAKVKFTDDQAFEAGCLGSVSHIIPLPLTEADLESMPASEILALPAGFDEEDFSNDDSTDDFEDDFGFEEDGFEADDD